MKPKCSECGKPLPEIAVKHFDPYCSTLCARKAHGAEGK